MRLIDADAFIWWVDDYYDCTELGQIVIEWINDRPTIEAEPVRRGRWIEGADGCVFCSECGIEWLSEAARYYNFCPICGARMGAETDGTN